MGPPLVCQSGRCGARQHGRSARGRLSVAAPVCGIQRCSGAIPAMAAANCACPAGSTGWCLRSVEAGSLPRKLLFFQLRAGRTGRGVKPPPQLGQTLCRMSLTQAAQKVHSYEQMRASGACGGKGWSQCSQLGRNSSMSGLCGY